MTNTKKQKSIGRKCSICNNGKVAEINRLIAKGISFRAISRQIFGSDDGRCSIGRHSENCLHLDSAVLQEQIKKGEAIDHHKELNAMFEDIRKHRNAANLWLTDPDNTDEFNLCPRGNEIDIIYLHPSKTDKNGQPTRLKDNLDNILADLDGRTRGVEKVFIKSVDLREFALKIIDKADMLLDKFAKVSGLYTQDRTNPDTLQRAANAINDVFKMRPDADRDYVISRICATANVRVDDVIKFLKL